MYRYIRRNVFGIQIFWWDLVKTREFWRIYSDALQRNGFAGSCCVNTTAVSDDCHKSDCFIMGSLVGGIFCLVWRAAVGRQSPNTGGGGWRTQRRCNHEASRPAGQCKLTRPTATNHSLQLFMHLKGGGKTILQIFCDFCRKNTWQFFFGDKFLHNGCSLGSRIKKILRLFLQIHSVGSNG